MYCINCGSNMDDNTKFCPSCGAKVDEKQQESESQAKPLQVSQQAVPPQASQQAPQPRQQQYAQSQQQVPQQYAQSQQQAPQQYAQRMQQPPPLQQAQAAKKDAPVKLIAIIVAAVLVLAGAGGVFLVLNRNDKIPQLAITTEPSLTTRTAADKADGDIDGAGDIDEANEANASQQSDNQTTSATSPSGETTTTELSEDDDATTGQTGAETSTETSAAVGEDAALPFVSYSYVDKKPEAVIEFSTIDSVFPSNYRSLEYMVIFAGYCDYGELDVLLEVEVPGFTQNYRQKVTLGRQVTKLRIVPPLVTGTIDLNSEKVAQLIYSVTEVDSGKLLVQESKNLKIYSKYDIIWGDQTNWDAYTDNILAWMTPDAPEITSLKRDAIDYLSFISDGALEGIYGYQDYHYFDHSYLNTWAQAVAIQGAMSDIVQVRYNNSWFSMDAQQRVKLPSDTLSSRSGLCVETSLVMASALQSSGMHAMLLFPPGHTQVAVEAWPATGDYYLIETTALPMAQDTDTWNSVVRYLTKDEWWGYISGDGDITIGPCYVVDCDLGEKLGIRAISN